MTVLLREAIGGSIRRARTERNRTLRDVSHSARVSLGYLSEIERGRKEPSSELLAAICDALKLPLPDLLDEVADALRPSAARRPRPVAVLDPALRTAVEEALEPVGESVPDAGDAEIDTETVPAGPGDDDTSASACLVEEGPSEDDVEVSVGHGPTPPVVLVGRVPLVPTVYAAA